MISDLINSTYVQLQSIRETYCFYRTYIIAAELIELETGNSSTSM